MEDLLTVQNNKPLSASSLKYLAIIAMLIDHIAWCFVDTYSVLGQIMHIIGRLTAPIMCYFIAEGYHYTRNVKKYALRLFIFALLSWPPFVYMESGQLPIGFVDGQFVFNPYQGVIYTLLLGLLALITVHSQLHIVLKVFVIFAICLFSLNGDWPLFAVVWILLFDKYRGDFKKQAVAFAVSSVLLEFLLFVVIIGNPITDNLFQLGVLLALIPLYLYNGQKGSVGKFNKWFFYIFYPAHLLILGLLKYNI